MNFIQKRYKDEMRMLCRDIIRSKGKILKFSKTKKDVNTLVDSINKKINEKPIIKEVEVEKASNNFSQQLTFEF